VKKPVVAKTPAVVKKPVTPKVIKKVGTKVDKPAEPTGDDIYTKRQ